MTTASMISSCNINNHNLNKWVNQMTEILKISSVQAINSQFNPNVYRLKPGNIKLGKREYPSVASVVAKHFKKLDASRKKAALLKIGSDPNITIGIRQLGIDIRSSKTITEQINCKKQFDFINGRNFTKKSVESMLSLMTAVSLPDLEFAPAIQEAIDQANEEAEQAIEDAEARINRRLNFRVSAVYCADETNPERFGGDEIAWGGVATNEYGNSRIIPEYEVEHSFDDDEVVYFSPSRSIHEFPLDGQNYPKTFLVLLGLAEKDAGGFATFLRALFEAIKADIQIVLNTLGAAAGAWIGSEIGGAIGTTISGPLGTVIGAVAGAILGALVGWLISALNDDIFEPQASAVILPSGNSLFPNGLPRTPGAWFNYYGHGGHYQVAYYWEIVR